MKNSSSVKKNGTQLAEQLDKLAKFLIGVAPCDFQAATKKLEGKFLEAFSLINLGHPSNKEEAWGTSHVSIFALISFSDAGQKICEAMQEDWRSDNVTIGMPNYRVHAGTGIAEISTWLAEELAQKLVANSRRNTMLTRELAVLRRMHEDTQQSFSKLERLAQTNGLLAPRKSDTLNEISPPLLLIGKETLPTSITQKLTASSYAVAAIDIFINSVTEPGILRIELSTLEDSQIVGKWTIDSRALIKGWNQFGLSRALDTDSQSLSLKVEWQGEGRIELGLSHRHPGPDWVVHNDGNPVGNRVLATRVWKSLPGIQTNLGTNAIFEDSYSKPKEWLISSSQLSRVEIINGPENHVAYIEQSSAILVQPVDRVPTVARLANTIPPGSRHIRANISIDHPTAGPAEYAIAVLNHNKKENNQDSSTQSLEWVLLDPGTQSQVNLFFDPPVTEWHDLFLMTRMPPNFLNTNCHALFSSIRISS